MSFDKDREMGRERGREIGSEGEKIFVVERGYINRETLFVKK